jgi:predicted Holliday junction resolvase-like endonuclease
MITLILSVVCIALGFIIAIQGNHLKGEITRLKTELAEKDAAHIVEKAKVKKDSTFRSSAVNWGKTIEHFVPFMTKFPVPPEDVVFLGMPIDYVGFTHTDSKVKCEVHFIEVKSGNAALMGKQRNIKRAIQEGRVHWHEIAVDSNRAEIIEE